MSNSNYHSASTSKHSLITPSPTPFSTGSSDGPSPTKKARLATRSQSRARSVATPGPAFSTQTFFRDESGEGITDLHEARRASSSRVLDIWSQLAERYSRPLAEDDIVDLRTEKIIQDRNVLRSTRRKYDIGCFGDQGASEGTATPTEEGEEGSDDELDAFAPGADISDELELVRMSKVKEREAQMDPADLEDLKEFMEAENRRREAYGSEGEEFEEEEGSSLEESEGEEEDFLTDGIEGGSEEPLFPSKETNRQRSLEEISGDISSSEDELGKWGDTDDAVHTISSVLADDSAANDIIDLSSPSPTPPPKAKRGRPKVTKTAIATSYKPASTPALKLKVSKTLERKASHLQLHTPPQSSSSTTGNTPDIPAASPISPPQSSSPLAKSKPGSQLQVRLKPPAHLRGSDNETTPKPSMKRGFKTKGLKPQGLKVTVDVLDPAPSRAGSAAAPKKSKAKQGKACIVDPSNDNVEVYSEGEDSTTKLHTPKPKPPKSTKGKAKFEKVTDAGGNAKGRAMTEISSPVQLSVRKRSGDTPDTGPASGSESLSLSPPSRKRKRKRVPSSSVEIEDPNIHNLHDSSAMAKPYALSISPDIGIIDFRRNGYVGNEREQSPIPDSRSRGKRKAEEKEKEKYEDPDPVDALSPVKISKRAVSASRSQPHSTPTPIFGPSVDSQHISYTEPQTPHRARHSTAPLDPSYIVPSLPHPYQPQYPHAAPLQEGQAQYIIDQTMHRLFYLLTASGHGQGIAHREQPQWLPQGPAHHHTLGLHHPNPEWAYATPTHHHYRHPSEALDTFGNPSARSSIYSTPVHPHPYPRSYTPSFSKATLPPSSSPDRSPELSPRAADAPLPRASSLARGRSKSKGRRVSFRIDDDHGYGLDKVDRHSLRFEAHEDDQVQKETGSSSPIPQRGRKKSERRDTSAPQEPSVVSYTHTSKRKMKSKSKGKAVASDSGTTEGDSETEVVEVTSRTSLERAQTPGPPVRSRSTKRRD
ncbi:hypothetical protein HWV62_41679 [Athelia sp. TMB]|nr:hypothetical protein HWV62_41679 [Athelia sp. TMB]